MEDMQLICDKFPVSRFNKQLKDFANLDYYPIKIFEIKKSVDYDICILIAKD